MFRTKPILQPIINENLKPWHGNNSVKKFYTGAGFVLKAVYTEYSDYSGHYCYGFQLSRYGMEITVYPIPEDCKYAPDRGIDKIAEMLNKQLPKNI